MALITGDEDDEDDEDDELLLDTEDEDVVELLAAWEDDDEEEEEDEDEGKIDMDETESDGSRRRVRRPCFELLCTNMLSDVASTVDMSTATVCVIATWKRRMSRGLPAFFKQF